MEDRVEELERKVDKMMIILHNHNEAIAELVKCMRVMTRKN
jgi:hypothetical protein